MLAYPELVGGTRDRLDTSLMKAADGRCVSKGGAEGLRGIGILRGPRNGSDPVPASGVAIKIEDGDGKDRGPWGATVEALRQVGVIEGQALRVLARYHRPVVLDPHGRQAAEAIAEFELAPVGELVVDPAAVTFQGDPYRTLGIAPGASLNEIRSAYRRLAKQWHPDAAGDRALPRFLAIQAAYERLVDSEGRLRPVAGRIRIREPAARARRGGPTRRAPGHRARRGAPVAPAARPRPGSSRAGRLGEARRDGGGRDAPGAGGDGDGPARGGEAPPRERHTRRGFRKATPGSTTYDEAADAPLDPEWEGGSWYGQTSRTYWTINPREYADPRKHGPEYQARARRAARVEDDAEAAAAAAAGIGDGDRHRGARRRGGRPEPDGGRGGRRAELGLERQRVDDHRRRGGRLGHARLGVRGGGRRRPAAASRPVPAAVATTRTTAPWPSRCRTSRRSPGARRPPTCSRSRAGPAGAGGC